MRTDEELESAKYLWNVLLREGQREYPKQVVWQRTKGKFTRAEKLDVALKILQQRCYIDLEYTQPRAGRGATVVIVREEAVKYIASSRGSRDR